MGSTPDGSALVTRTSVTCAVGDTHHGTRRKAQVRLAAAGSLLTAVALELVAGKTWAAGLTRTLGAELDRYSTTRSIQLEESTAAFGRRGRLGCPPAPSGMLRVGGRGHRPRAGPPLGRPGPEAGRQDWTRRSTWLQSRSVARRPPHGVTGTARFSRAKGSLRKPGRPGGRTQSPTRSRPMCARGTETPRSYPAGLGYGLAQQRLATARAPGTPTCATAAGPRTDSDGTSHLAFTSAHSGSDCAWTRLPRHLPQEDPPMGPDTASEFPHPTRAGAGPTGSSSSSRPTRAVAAGRSRNHGSITGDACTTRDWGNNGQ